MKKDIVCAMMVNEEIEREKGNYIVYRSETYYFCTNHCKIKFMENPNEYLKNIQRKEGILGKEENK